MEKAAPRANLIEGNIAKTLTVFAIPYLLANLLQAMYGTADLIIIGQFSDVVSDTSAMSNASHIIHVITHIFTSFSMGGTVLIGQYLGAKQPENINRTIGTLLTLFTVIGVTVSILTVACAGLIVDVMNIPPEAAEAARTYIIICGAGFVFMTLYNTFSAILRGLGDSKSPLLFIAIACAINILGDLLLIGVFDMGVAGAAYATVFAQAVSVVFAAWQLRRKHAAFDFKRASFGIDREKVRRLLRIGIPIAIETTLVNISFLFIAALINRYGVIASAAIGVNERIGSLTRLPASAFSAAITAMVAQNMGAGLIERAKRTMWTGIFIAFGMCSVFFIIMQLFPEALIRLYVKDAEVIEAGVLYLRTFSADTLLVCFTFGMAGFFSGCGKTMFTLYRNMTSTFLVRVPLAYLFCLAPVADMLKIGLAAPLASLASIIICLLYFRFGNYKNATVLQ